MRWNIFKSAEGILQKMRWLQWGTIALDQGIGGVEMHARCLARELKSSGVDVRFGSGDATLKDPTFAVIQTHGSLITFSSLKMLWSLRKSGIVWVHTLHGTTLGRMIACREWFWVGGYLAYLKEILAVLGCSMVSSVNRELSLFKWAKLIGKQTCANGNGWDSYQDEPGFLKQLSPELKKDLEAFMPFWLFVGRGEDRVKGADRLIRLVHQNPAVRIVAVTGNGFPKHPQILATGKLMASQVREVMLLSEALVIPSRYEGYSLALVEALSLGVKVVSTEVGIFSQIEKKVKGLFNARKGSFTSILLQMQKLKENASQDHEDKKDRGAFNRENLSSWKTSAGLLLENVRQIQ